LCIVCITQGAHLIWLHLAALALATPEISAVEAVMITELERSVAALEAQESPPYYIAVVVEDRHRMDLVARDGTTGGQQEIRTRFLDVDLRVGTPALDSTHPLRGFSDLDSDNRRAVRIPNNDAGIQHAMWREIDARYRQARERIVLVEANLAVKVAEETAGEDFELRDPISHRQTIAPVRLDQDAWSGLLNEISAGLTDHPLIHQHALNLSVVRSEKTFVDSAGSRVVHGRTHARLYLHAAATVDDGDLISVFEATDVHDPTDLPDAAAVRSFAEHAVKRIVALHAAPRGEPYSGPVLLEGMASGVFFHEVLGHRVEGHRQKREDEGKTFAEHVGRSILPPFIDVYDDPRIAQAHDIDLNGHYDFDDEGVAADRASIVEDGVFVGFLMGRSPVEGSPHSNGHGRRSAGNAPLARMGNTIVEASTTVSRDVMRQKLIREIQSQNLDYGYIVEDIEGGFTLTGRTAPNAFNVRATASWRVYADGRPDELVRGIDLVGTPLVAFRNLMHAGDDPQVFNGTCGAESGWVPVSAVAPSLLFRTLEMQRKEKGQDRPPLLPKPGQDGSADAGEAQ
jgi:predicted Zn-dependent protease